MSSNDAKKVEKLRHKLRHKLHHSRYFRLVQILEKCQQGKSTDTLMKIIRVHRSTINRDLKILLDAGLIENIESSKRGVYETTPGGVQLLNIPCVSSNVAPVKTGPLFLHRFHNEGISCLVRGASKGFWQSLEKSAWTLDTLRTEINQHVYKKKDLPFNGWKATFQVHPKRTKLATIVLWVEVYETYDPNEGQRVIIERVLTALEWFARRYHAYIVLDDPNFIKKIHEHIALVNTPLAEFAISHGYAYDGKTFALDASEGPPEEEYKSAKHAIQDKEHLGRVLEKIIETRHDPVEAITEVKNDYSQMIDVLLLIKTFDKELVETLGFAKIKEYLNGNGLANKEEKDVEHRREFYI